MQVRHAVLPNFEKCLRKNHLGFPHYPAILTGIFQQVLAANINLLFYSIQNLNTDFDLNSDQDIPCFPVPCFATAVSLLKQYRILHIPMY